MEAGTQRAVTPYSLLPPAPATTNLLFVFIYLLFRNIYTFAGFFVFFFAEFLLMGVCFDVQNKAETKNNKAWLEGEGALSWLTLRPLLEGGPRIHLVRTAKRVERGLCWCSACMFPAPWVPRLPWQPGSILCPAYPWRCLLPRSHFLWPPHHTGSSTWAETRLILVSKIFLLSTWPQLILVVSESFRVNECICARNHLPGLCSEKITRVSRCGLGVKGRLGESAAKGLWENIWTVDSEVPYALMTRAGGEK